MRKLPTKIITEPAFKDPSMAANLRGDKWFMCDDDKWYTMRSVAKYLAKHMKYAPTYQGLVSRVYRWGWDHPFILASTIDRHMPLNPNRRREGSGPSEEWLSLGTRPRDYALSRIKNPGRWEERHAGKRD